MAVCACLFTVCLPVSIRSWLCLSACLYASLSKHLSSSVYLVFSPYFYVLLCISVCMPVCSVLGMTKLTIFLHISTYVHIFALYPEETFYFFTLITLPLPVSLYSPKVTLHTPHSPIPPPPFSSLAPPNTPRPKLTQFQQKWCSLIFQVNIIFLRKHN